MKHERIADLILGRLQYSEPFKELVKKGQQRKARRAIARTLEVLLDEILELPMGEDLGLQGFGRFSWRQQEERSHYNMITQQMEKIPAKLVLHFEPARGTRRKLSEVGGGDHGGGAGQPDDQDEDGVRLREVPVVDKRLEKAEED